jgi:hypothetical protein
MGPLGSVSRRAIVERQTSSYLKEIGFYSNLLLEAIVFSLSLSLHTHKHTHIEKIKRICYTPIVHRTLVLAYSVGVPINNIGLTPFFHLTLQQAHNMGCFVFLSVNLHCPDI